MEEGDGGGGGPRDPTTPFVASTTDDNKNNATASDDDDGGEESKDKVASAGGGRIGGVISEEEATVVAAAHDKEEDVRNKRLLNKQKHYIKSLLGKASATEEIVHLNASLLDRDVYKDLPLLHHGHDENKESKESKIETKKIVKEEEHDLDEDDKDEDDNDVDDDLDDDDNYEDDDDKYEDDDDKYDDDDDDDVDDENKEQSDATDTFKDGDRPRPTSRPKRRNKNKHSSSSNTSADGGASVGTKNSKSKMRELTEEEKVFYELYAYCKAGDHVKLEQFINKIERNQEERRLISNVDIASSSSSSHTPNDNVISSSSDVIATGDSNALVQKYISIEAIINTPDWGGTYPLHIACMMRNMECAKILVKNGAKPDAKDAMGRTAFFYFKQLEDVIEKKKGTENDNFLQLKKLIKVTDKNYVDSEDESIKTYKSAYKSLIDAAYIGDLEAIKRSLAEDITYLEYLDHKGHTPLMYAMMGDQVEAAKLLMDYGANFYRKNGNNRITIDFMKHVQHAKDLRTYNYWRGAHYGPDVQCTVGGVPVPAALRPNHGPMRVSFLIKVEEDEAYQKRHAIMRQFRKEQRRRAQHELLELGFYVLTRQNFSTAFVFDLIEIARDNVRDHLIDEIIKEEHDNFIIQFDDELAAMAAEYKRNCDAVAAAKLKARLEAEEAARQRAAAELAARLEAERIARLKLEAETAEKVRRLQHAKRRKDAEAQALAEWNENEERLREEKWLRFAEDRPHRVHLYRRMRLSLKTIGGIPYSPRTEEENPLVDTYS